MLLLSLLCLLSAAPSVLGVTLSSNPLQKGFNVRCQVSQVDYVPFSHVLIQYSTSPGNGLLPFNYSGSSPYTLLFDSPFTSIGFFSSEQSLNSPNTAFFLLNSEATVIDVFNLSSIVALHFPNDTSLTSRSVSFSAVSKGIVAHGTLIYDPSLQLLGHEVSVWKLLLYIYVGCFVLALLDNCRHPQRAQACSRVTVTLGNSIWLFFGGLGTGLSYLVVGLVLILTIILSPFGVKLVRFAMFSLFPFGREVREDMGNAGVCSVVGNVLYFLLVGLPLVLTHLILGLALLLGLITIPFGLKHIQLAKLALMPFGHSVAFTEDWKNGDGYQVIQGPRYV